MTDQIRATWNKKKAEPLLQIPRELQLTFSKPSEYSLFTLWFWKKYMEEKLSNGLTRLENTAKVQNMTKEELIRKTLTEFRKWRDEK